jgi:small subunit ribosomal protein S17
MSNKMTKTVSVEISRSYRHPLYHKVVTSRRQVKAHDELDCQIGDKVVIVESRPISKTKRWVVQEILSSDIVAADAAEAAEAEATEAEIAEAEARTEESAEEEA